MNSTKKSLVIGLLLVIVICSAFGGGYLFSQQSQEDTASEETRIIVDGTGREITIPAKVDRVVSLVTGVTGIFYAIGAEDVVVGVTQSLPFPTKYFYPESEYLAEDVGSIANINVEAVVALDPDVVFTTEFYITNAEALEEKGIPVISIRLNSIEDLLWNVQFVGSIVNKNNAANELVQEMKATVQEISDKTNSLSDNERKTVYVEFSGKTYGASTWCTDFIAQAGGVNIYGDSATKMPVPSYEYVIEQNPDAIFLYLVAEDEQDFKAKAEAAIEEAKTRAGWSAIDAVKNNNFCVVGARGSFGPDMIEYVVAMGKFLYPDLFTDISYPDFIYTTTG